jgi:hypothetical protein
MNIDKGALPLARAALTPEYLDQDEAAKAISYRPKYARRRHSLATEPTYEDMP